jgi:hypothetical protein
MAGLVLAIHVVERQLRITGNLAIRTVLRPN